MIMAVIAFIVAGSLQLRMQNLSTFAKLPSVGCYHLRIINLMPDTAIRIISEQDNFPNITELLSLEATPYYSYNIGSDKNISVEFTMDKSYLESQNYPQKIIVNSSEMDTYEHLSYSFIVGLGPDINGHSNVISTMINDDWVPEYEISKVRIFTVNNLQHNHNLTSVEIAEQQINITAMQPSKYLKIPYGSHAILINGVFEKILSFKSGSIYTIVISFNNQNNKTNIRVFADVEPRPLSILWQIPQYMLLTSGEVLFTITGLDFAYTMSPASMRSFVTAAWLLTVSTGNLIVILFEGIKITNNMAFELFIFAGLLFVTTIIFTVISHYFIPYNPHVTKMNDFKTIDENPVSEVIE
ncbi:Solute carrier family 15 member 1 [Thelohanellus kitauei]|uniref:Solute carrier family 15 member 1 n=1 Tax=Thelohanellus kitauei TaxID=669202 RepID=A0A0C2JGK0_THEKT|nr:Solute carrier family 15 member 1 [Thelohanellus kitauei]